MNQTNINRFITTSLCGIFRFKKILISKPLCDVRMSSFNSAFAKLDLNYLLDFLPFDIYLYVFSNFMSAIYYTSSALLKIMKQQSYSRIFCCFDLGRGRNLQEKQWNSRGILNAGTQAVQSFLITSEAIPSVFMSIYVLCYSINLLFGHFRLSQRQILCLYS